MNFVYSALTEENCEMISFLVGIIVAHMFVTGMCYLE